MIIKSYEVQKNLQNLLKYKLFLLYGENTGLKKDIKAFRISMGAIYRFHNAYNIDPFITYMNDNNRHTLKTRYLKLINYNSTNGQDNIQDKDGKTPPNVLLVAPIPMTLQALS